MLILINKAFFRKVIAKYNFDRLMIIRVITKRPFYNVVFSASRINTSTATFNHVFNERERVPNHSTAKVISSIISIIISTSNLYKMDSSHILASGIFQNSDMSIHLL
ncbi:MAG: hypothetical protein CME37_19360 [Haliea sp.]|nr:hypothetical protein [Haliea sp.]